VSGATCNPIAPKRVITNSQYNIITNYNIMYYFNENVYLLKVSYLGKNTYKYFCICRSSKKIKNRLWLLLL